MEIAFTQYTHQLWEKAAKTFQYAINTGMLNDKGRLVCYWHIADSCEKAAMTDCAAEAYMFFTIAADDVLHPRAWNGNDLPPDEQFINGFGVNIKLDYALNYINVLWDTRTAP